MEQPEYVKLDPETFDEKYKRQVKKRLGQLLSPSTESDPDNIPSGERGAKLDKGKPPVARGCLQYFPHAIEAVAKVSEVGASKYSWKGWEAVRDGERRYLDACGRHLLRSDPDERKRDDDTGLLHLAQVAWNALAALELALRDGVPLFDPKKG